MHKQGIIIINNILIYYNQVKRGKMTNKIDVNVGINRIRRVLF